MLVFHASGLSRGFVSDWLAVSVGCRRQSIFVLSEVCDVDFDELFLMVETVFC